MTENRIGVRNLTSKVSAEHLREIFGVYGEIIDIFQPSSGEVAFIEFRSFEDAGRALAHFDGGEIDNQKLRVQFAPRPQRRDRRHDGGRYDQGRRYDQDRRGGYHGGYSGDRRNDYDRRPPQQYRRRSRSPDDNYRRRDDTNRPY